MRVAGTPVIIKEGEDDDDPKSGDSATAVERKTTTLNLGKEIGDPYVGWKMFYQLT